MLLKLERRRLGRSLNDSPDNGDECGHNSSSSCNVCTEKPHCSLPIGPVPFTSVRVNTVCDHFALTFSLFLIFHSWTCCAIRAARVRQYETRFHTATFLNCHETKWQTIKLERLTGSRSGDRSTLNNCPFLARAMMLIGASNRVYSVAFAVRTYMHVHSSKFPFPHGTR